jgi:hypothetical protein
VGPMKVLESELALLDDEIRSHLKKSEVAALESLLLKLSEAVKT